MVSNTQDENNLELQNGKQSENKSFKATIEHICYYISLYIYYYMVANAGQSTPQYVSKYMVVIPGYL